MRQRLPPERGLLAFDYLPVAVDGGSEPRGSGAGAG
jgi:hypothetical protein